MNIVLETIKKRRSTRAYEDTQITQAELDQILEAAIYAPSAHNDQPWYFTVIQNKAVIQEINTKAKQGLAQSPIDWRRKIGENPTFDLMYNAPTLIIISGRTDAVSPLVDCSAAIQNMLLVAESLGLGSVWLGLIREYLNQDTAASSKLKIPDGYTAYYGVALGYKKNKKAVVAPTRNRDVVHYIR